MVEAAYRNQHAAPTRSICRQMDADVSCSETIDTSSYDSALQMSDATEAQKKSDAYWGGGRGWG